MHYYFALVSSILHFINDGKLFIISTHTVSGILPSKGSEFPLAHVLLKMEKELFDIFLIQNYGDRVSYTCILLSKDSMGTSYIILRLSLCSYIFPNTVPWVAVILPEVGPLILILIVILCSD